MNWTRAAALIFTGLAIAAGAVGLVWWAPWSSGSDMTASSSRWTSTHRALCDAASEAGVGDVASARRVFYDRAHDALHDLARLAAADHREAAARLLEAKEQVETLLDAPTTALQDMLRRLARGTRNAAAAVGDPINATCTEEG